MENEKRTDRNSWAELDENRLSDILTASQIKATDTYVTPPQIIWIDNSTIATLGNFSASTGKAKAKKTFNVSAIVAASLAGRQVLNYRAHLPEGKRRILYVDTEQSRFHCHNVLERILRLAGLPTTTDNENLDFICLREYTPAVRIEVIDYALRQNKGYGLVIIDGIRDLMLDINSTSESVEVINKMMEWSSKYDLHIHCVLHLNKGDNNVRGHIGTEMSNKAETVLVIIDTLQRIRGQTPDNGSYAVDYDTIAKLKAFSDQRGIALLLVHHTRKEGAEDVFDTISSTNGILGAADGALVLHKDKRTSGDAILDVVGRDQPQMRLRLRFDPTHSLWQVTEVETEPFKEPPNPLLEFLSRLVNEENPLWSGTATELVQCLSEMDSAQVISPNWIVRTLNVRQDDLLRKYGIRYGSRRTKDGKVILLRWEGVR